MVRQGLIPNCCHAVTDYSNFASSKTCSMPCRRAFITAGNRTERETGALSSSKSWQVGHESHACSACREKACACSVMMNLGRKSLVGFPDELLPGVSWLPYQHWQTVASLLKLCWVIQTCPTLRVL